MWRRLAFWVGNRSTVKKISYPMRQWMKRIYLWDMTFVIVARKNLGTCRKSGIDTKETM